MKGFPVVSATLWMNSSLHSFFFSTFSHFQFTGPCGWVQIALTKPYINHSQLFPLHELTQAKCMLLNQCKMMTSQIAQVTVEESWACSNLLDQVFFTQGIILDLHSTGSQIYDNYYNIMSLFLCLLNVWSMGYCFPRLAIITL